MRETKTINSLTMPMVLTLQGSVLRMITSFKYSSTSTSAFIIKVL